MNGIVVKINGNPLIAPKIAPKVEEKPNVDFRSIHKGEVEELRKRLVYKWATFATAVYLGVRVSTLNSVAFASSAGVEHIRDGFMQIIDVMTAIVEPILWFYALTGCVMMATGKNKELGWQRIKQVGYAYIGIQLLPTFFMLCRYISVMMKNAIHF